MVRGLKGCGLTEYIEKMVCRLKGCVTHLPQCTSLIYPLETVDWHLRPLVSTVVQKTHPVLIEGVDGGC